MNILWQKPDSTLAFTAIADGLDAVNHSYLLQDRGDIPFDWMAVGFNVAWPDTGWAHESYRWDGVTIVVDIASARAEVQAKIQQGFAASLNLPVVSTALGDAHTYQSDPEARNFLNNLITLGSGGKFACADGNGLVARRQHTAAQLLQVGEDIRVSVEAQFDKYEALIASISTADEAALKTIVW